VKQGFRADIQGLRTLAVGLVILAHLVTYGVVSHHSELHHLAGGFIGVDVFFVLSGYLITSLLVRECEDTGRISLVDFYARRAKRILPAATVVLVAVLAYAALRLPSRQTGQFRTDAWWSSLFLANWHFAHIGTSYFDTTSLSPFEHYWSLAVEEQFYLVWPLILVVLVPRLRRRVLIAVVGTVAIASFAWSLHVTVYGGEASRTAAYFSTPARAYELALGALLAVLPLPVLRAPIRLLLGLAGIATLAIATWELGENAPFPGWHALIPTAATVALLVSGSGALNAVTRPLSTRPARYLGDISYSLYLWHFPVIVLGRSYLPDGWRVRYEVGLQLAITLVLAILSYHLVERPFLRHRKAPKPAKAGKAAKPERKRRPRLALALWPVTLAIVAASVIGAGAYTRHGLAEREQASADWWADHPAAQLTATQDDGPDTSTGPTFTALADAVSLAKQGAPIPPAVNPNAIENDNWHDRYTCAATNGQSSVELCPIGDTKAHRTVVVTGDSHAGMWLPAFDALGQQQHVKVIPMVKLSCAPYDVDQPMPNMPQSECDGFRSWARGQIQRIHPDAVYLIGRGLLDVRYRDGQNVADQWRTGVTRAVRAIKPLTKRVVVVGDVPSRPRDPAVCLSDPHATERSCLAPQGGPEWRSNALTRDGATAAGVDYVGLVPLVCYQHKCPLVVGTSVLYRDVSHLTMSWVRRITNRFGALIGPLGADAGGSGKSSGTGTATPSKQPKQPKPTEPAKKK